MKAEPSRVDRECVEGFLFAPDPVELLIFRRGPDRGRIWVPISGKVEPGDAGFEAALRRELAEETGLTDPRRVVPLDWEVTFPMNEGETWRLHAFAVEVPRSFEPRLSSEHEASEWVTPPEAVRRFHFEDNRAAVARLLERVATRSPTL